MAVNRVHRLPPALANQIAAGEVVERPASVVKELVENAVDAGARRVAITIDFGGKKLIVVEDDGEGMSREDAELALERHATSKISSADDLAAISTLGFRGEALPSIASVSRFRLRTRSRGAIEGTEIRVDGGHPVSVREVGAPEGTLVEVADLFFNLPARRKFLKADTAEAAQVSRLATQLALGYPHVGFVVRSGGRILLEAPPAGSLEDRFYQIYGDRPHLVAVHKDAARISVRGFIAALGDQGPVRGPQHLFVNGRIVRDRTIAHAIQQAYSVATIKERSPEVHLFIELPADRVDVNVHPTKAEVRFLDQGLVHEVLRRSLLDAFGDTGAPELILTPGQPLAAPSPFALPLGFAAIPDAGARPFVPAGWGGSSGDTTSRADGSAGAIESAGFAGMTGADGSIAGQGAAATGSVDPGAASQWTAAGAPMGTSGRNAIADLIRPMTPLGQFRNTFIIAADEDGLAIIDQHV
ncbi:MAG: DNA mismatch repair endonuclease MutL, partial [Vicinamibacterales bacterium]